MTIEKIREQIKDARPNIRPSSLNLYINTLNKLSKLYHDNKETISSGSFLKDKKKVCEIIKTKKPNTQKSYLASIVVYLMAIDEEEDLISYYRDLMEMIAKEQDDVIKKQEKTPSQEANWATLEELKGELERQRKLINKDKLWNKDPGTISNKDFETLQKYVAGSLYLASDENPPLRSDYGDMKIICGKDYAKLSEADLKKNYIVNKSRNKKLFHLGEYKTASTYGEKRIPVGSELNKILNKWLKINKYDYLLVNKLKKPMTPNQLTKYLPKVFENLNKKIGISLLRHIYISEKFPPQLQEQEETADLMAHSIDQQSKYSKK